MQPHELETYDRESQMRGSCFLQQLTTAGEPQAPVQPYGQLCLGASLAHRCTIFPCHLDLEI